MSEFKIGDVVNISSLDSIYNVLILLSDINDEENTGILRYIGEPNEVSDGIVQSLDEVFVIYNSVEGDDIDYEE